MIDEHLHLADVAAITARQLLERGVEICVVGGSVMTIHAPSLALARSVLEKKGTDTTWEAVSGAIRALDASDASTAQRREFALTELHRAFLTGRGE